MLNRNPLIGEIFECNFQGFDHVQTGKRPGLIISNNLGNRMSPNVIVLPLTSSVKKFKTTKLPTHVPLLAVETGLRYDSVVLCENPTTISKKDVGNYITTLSEYNMKKVAFAYLISSSILSFVSEKEVISTCMEIWDRSKELNTA